MRQLGMPSVALLLTVFSLPVSAQDPILDDTAGQEGAVYARLLYLEGPVTVQGSIGADSEPMPNDPVVPGDVVATGVDGRGEIQLADGSVLRLDFETELSLLSLSDITNQLENTTILQLARGSLILRAQQMDSNEKRFQIDTDGASIFLLSDGNFRIDVRPDGSTIVRSRGGVAEIMAQDVSTMLRSGERLTVRPGGIPGEPLVYNTRIIDEFDAWATERDAVLMRRPRIDDQIPAGLPEPVQPYAVELSYYGHWYNNPSYGWVWRPMGLAAGWQPYTYGRWVSSPAGLVWVSYEPWGWAPFHYGRWELLLGTGWVWIPGYVFSGAYVAWSVSPGYFGWCPLGYYDYPIAYYSHAGYRADPWVYVSQHNLYAKHVHKTFIYDQRIRGRIYKERVVVRGLPPVNPRRLTDSPRFAEEFHRVALARGDLRLGQQDEFRQRVPFHEKERQRLVRLNNQRSRDRSRPGLSVSGGQGGRPVSVIDPGRSVSVPRRPPARVGNSGRQAPRGQVSPGDTRSTPRRRPTSVTGPPAAPEDSLPDRIKRIIPRSSSPTQPKASSSPQQETGQGKTAGPGSRAGSSTSGAPQRPAAKKAGGKGSKAQTSQPSGSRSKSSRKGSGSKGGSGDKKGSS